MDNKWRENTLSDALAYISEVGGRDTFSRPFLLHGKMIVENIRKMERHAPGTYGHTLASLEAMVAFVESRLEE